MPQRLFLLLILLALVAGCGMQPMPVRQDDMAQGPGVFTGQAGEWVLTPDMLRQRPTPTE
jgi:hypothetical protein